MVLHPPPCTLGDMYIGPRSIQNGSSRFSYTGFTFPLPFRHDELSRPLLADHAWRELPHRSKQLAVRCMAGYFWIDMLGFHIYTIGHGGRTMDEIVRQMRNKGIQFVIDVRSVPYSKYQPEFARKPLAQALRNAGLKYGFMGHQLGGRPDDESCYDNGHVNYEKVRTMPFFKEGIARLRTACERKFIVCLLCAEANPAQCHRSGMIGEALVKKGIEVEHLLKDGNCRSQGEVMYERTGGQEELFSDLPAPRKSYSTRPVR